MEEVEEEEGETIFDASRHSAQDHWKKQTNKQTNEQTTTTTKTKTNVLM